MLKQMEEREVRIGENTFHVTAFPAFKAARISGELTPVLAPIISALAPLIGELTKDSETGGETSIWDIDITTAVSKLGSFSISGEALENLARTLLLGGHIVAENVLRDDGSYGRNVLTEDLVNEVFCGSLDDMYILCWEVIKLNFGGFFQKKTARSGEKNTSQIPVNKHRIL